MITCFKHKIDYVGDECPRCKFPELYYSSDNPVHKSDFMLGEINQLNALTNKLKDINNRLKKLLKENE